MTQTPSRQQWVTVRVSEAEVLRKVKQDMEARHGASFSWGQVVLMLCRQYLDGVRK